MNPNLTDREQEILCLIAQDYTSRELAEKLFISFETVRTHRKNLIRKLNVKTTGGLVSQGFRMGLIHLSIQSNSFTN